MAKPNYLGKALPPGEKVNVTYHARYPNDMDTGEVATIVSASAEEIVIRVARGCGTDQPFDKDFTLKPQGDMWWCQERMQLITVTKTVTAEKRVTQWTRKL